MEYPTVSAYRIDSLEERIERIERDQAAAKTRAMNRLLFFACASWLIALAMLVFLWTR
jgi:hypothetical protein